MLKRLDRGRGEVFEGLIILLKNADSMWIAMGPMYNRVMANYDCKAERTDAHLEQDTSLQNQFGNIPFPESGRDVR